MSTLVLKSKSEISRARSELRRMNASCLPSRPIDFLRRHGLAGGFTPGDRLKSWDVLNTTVFLRDRLPKTAHVIDIGAYASEILPALHRLGFTSLTGIDLNPEIRKMPYSDVIRYEIGNFLQMPFEDSSFDAVTATSVIEHGFDAPRLLAELTRLLRPGGYFVASFDYWPDQIDTAGMKIFGMDWIIFSREGILQFLAEAQGYGLEPAGEISLEAGDKVIHWGGKQYTFGWIALRKAR